MRVGKNFKSEMVQCDSTYNIALTRIEIIVEETNTQLLPEGLAPS